MPTATLKIQPPPTHTGPITDAHQRACDEQTPVFVPTQWFVDDRGYSLMNQLQGALSPEGQINFSVMHPGVIKAWHRHQKQTDFWLVLHGHLKIGVHRENDDTAWAAVVGERKPGVMVIPPPLWHGAATVGDAPAGLLYYVTHQYDPAAPDEERRPWDEPGEFPWAVQFK